VGIDFCVEPDIDVRNLVLGFPGSGGVWVIDGRKGWDGFYSGIRGLNNALTMEERCGVIRDSGGKFCESMMACEEAAVLVGDVEILKRSLDREF